MLKEVAQTKREVSPHTAHSQALTAFKAARTKTKLQINEKNDRRTDEAAQQQLKNNIMV